MITVHLYGVLAKKFGKSFKFDAATPAEVVQALSSQLAGFRDVVREGNWAVIRGEVAPDNAIGEEDLELRFGEDKEMHLMPEAEGRNNGVFQFIIGVILVVIGVLNIWNAGAGAIAAGIGMMVGGIIAMTTKMPSVDTEAKVDGRQSFLFDGASNISAQGVAVPRGYGRMRVGSVVVSAGLYSEEIAREDEFSSIPDNTWVNLPSGDYYITMPDGEQHLVTTPDGGA